jgi:hypothetical protein
VLIRRNYQPSRPRARNAVEQFALDARAGRLSADDLLTRYVTIVYSRTGSYEETARRLGLDRRTVKAKVDRGLLHPACGRVSLIPACPPPPFRSCCFHRHTSRAGPAVRPEFTASRVWRREVASEAVER